MATHLRTELVVEALEMAVEQRRPEAVVHHSDQGCQYTSLAFGGRCREWGVALSMGSVGDCFDNAMAESFFATLECELLARTTLATHAEARAAIFEFIEGWYNTRRRHSALSYASPLEFERLHAAAREPTPHALSAVPRQGPCIPSGVVEAGCKQIGDRLKRAGMRWTVAGANAIVAQSCLLRSWSSSA